MVILKRPFGTEGTKSFHSFLIIYAFQIDSNCILLILGRKNFKDFSYILYPTYLCVNKLESTQHQVQKCAGKIFENLISYKGTIKETDIQASSCSF